MYKRMCAWCDNNVRFNFFKDYYIPLNVKSIMLLHEFDPKAKGAIYKCSMMATPIATATATDDNIEVTHSYYGEDASEDEAIRQALGNAMRDNLFPNEDAQIQTPMQTPMNPVMEKEVMEEKVIVVSTSMPIYSVPIKK